MGIGAVLDENSRFECKHLNRNVTVKSCVDRQRMETQKFCHSGNCLKGRDAQALLVQLGGKIVKTEEAVKPVLQACQKVEAPLQLVAPDEMVERVNAHQVATATDTECTCGPHARHGMVRRRHGTNCPVSFVGRHRRGEQVRSVKPVTAGRFDPKLSPNEELAACVAEAKARAQKLWEDSQVMVKRLRGEQ